MSRTLRDSFQFAAAIGDQLVEKAAPSASELLTILRRGEIWGEASIYPKLADFPRALLSFHEGHGFVVQCYEDQRSRSDFLVTAGELSRPHVEIQLGGQALERWPQELFVPEALAVEALEWFLDSGKLKPDLHWVRIDRFPREIVWEGREGRDAWERSHGSREQSDA
ncbi:MAG: hypothetical protein HYW06_10805 [Gemmatimonadetes bacterium]|nr:hypothetical protein [Gemmatimonadota bacterium]MBI2537427.1 hypothetical protein [Gemmatimonadota bacterium]